MLAVLFWQPPHEFRTWEILYDLLFWLAKATFLLCWSPVRCFSWSQKDRSQNSEPSNDIKCWLKCCITDPVTHLRCTIFVCLISLRTELFEDHPGLIRYLCDVFRVFLNRGMPNVTLLMRPPGLLRPSCDLKKPFHLSNSKIQRTAFQRLSCSFVFRGYGTVTSTILPQYFPTMGQHMGSRGESQPILCLHHHSYRGTLREWICKSQHVIGQVSGVDPGPQTFQIKDLHPIIRWLRSDFLEFFHPEFVDNDGISRTYFSNGLVKNHQLDYILEVAGYGYLLFMSWWYGSSPWCISPDSNRIAWACAERPLTEVCDLTHLSSNWSVNWKASESKKGKLV